LKIRKALILWCIISIVVLGACGKKGPPMPWRFFVPKRIVDLEAMPREGGLFLTWTAPKENTDNSPLTNLAKFQVLRSEGNLVNGECQGCGGMPEVVYEMKLESKEEATGKKITVFFDNLEARKVYVYQVISVNRRGYPSAPSNPVTVYWEHLPQAPEMLRGEPGYKKVDLSWEPVEGATGYNIYRRGENEIFPINPLNKELITTTQYTDLSVENEKKYIYSVRAVKRVVKTDVEGKGSLEVSVTPTDIIPPSAPVGLVAIPLKNGIELKWRRNLEPDLLGYYVYRRRVGEKEFKRINEIPLEKETYLDTQVELEHDYEYAVSAVDNSPRKNESPLSEVVRVKYIY
jgi:fibronectin type 3 domain-containing protein